MTDAAEPLLAIEGLNVAFRGEAGTARVVEDLSLEIRAGEAVGLVGESGCGKSVTAMSVMRLLPTPPAVIEARRIGFDGADLNRLAEAKMRAIRGDRIGMIFQEPMTSLNPTLTIGFQIAEVLRRSTRRCGSWSRSASAPRAGGSRSIRTSSRAACGSAS
jgi:ABC-type microcin C transport system duplicated ATPase subunit YejF